ncbi:MAG: outer membrane beta-barrel protein [Bacteroides sp.]|nr:outer membrane beta-barrel protein [Bacteroides sp.]
MKTKFLLLLLLTFSLPLMAQRKVSVTGNVYDRVTTKDLTHVDVTVLNPDSTIAAETDAYLKTLVFRDNKYLEVEYGRFTLDLPILSQPYILRLSKEGYSTLEQPLDLSKTGARQVDIKLPPIYMTPETRNPTVNLDEVVVKSSKVMFYHKGDTIVYNADAFMLPEGSSLDALIAKLPGVEIRDGGKIYVNGKYVESLLLNGKDFFKGNQDVMRQNLGAYTVKDIAVYDKTGELSRLTGTELENDKEYVMDVRLKKDYMGAFMGNAEGGYGTDDRYSARLFAMHFNNNARFSLYGNINNVNNTNRPDDGQGFALYNGERYEGIYETTNGGFDYLVEDPRKVWSVNGNVDVKYTDNKVTKNVFTESFLKTNSFQTSLSSDRSKPLNLSTSHKFKYFKESYYIKIDPDFSYSRNRSESQTTSAEFDSNVQERHDIDMAVINAIYTGTYDDLRKALINRNRFNRENRSNSYNVHLNTEQALRIPGSSDAITVWVEGKYTRDHGNSLTGQRIDYGFNGIDAPVNSSAFMRENQQYPAYTGWWRGATRYMLNTRKVSASIGYEYRHEEQRKSSYEFLADTHTEDEEATLPDFSVMAPDLGNTNTSKLSADIHMIKGSLSYDNELPGGMRLILDFRPEFHIRRRSLRYNAFEPEGAEFLPVAIPVERTSGSFNNSNFIINLRSKDKKFGLYANYKVSTEYASLTDMIDIPNTTDPLNIWHGNPDLKNAFMQDAFITCSYTPKNTYIAIGAFMQSQSRALVKGYTFNSATGVRDFQTVNVNGNREFNTHINLQKTFTFGIHELRPMVYLHYNYFRYANMIGEDGPMNKQMVNSNDFMYQIMTDYTLLQKYSFMVGVRGNDIHSHMQSTKNADTNSTNTTIDLRTNLKLPFNLSFFGQMSYTSYKGTDSRGMNPNQCILNANINYTLNANWSFKVQGYDLLGQQKPYTNRVSASSRVQTIVNTLPRYTMFTVTYKFNTKKSK